MLYPDKDIQVASLKRELYTDPPNQSNMAKRKRRNRKSKLRRVKKVIYISIKTTYTTKSRTIKKSNMN